MAHILLHHSIHSQCDTTPSSLYDLGVTKVSRLSETIASASDIKTEDVEVPEWGVTLRVKGMDGHKRAEMLETYTNAEGMINYEALMPAMIICCSFDPEDDSLVFAPGDESMILDKAAFVMERVAGVAMRLSGLDKSAEERLGKAATSGSSPAQSGTPSTSTPSIVSTTN